MSIVYIPYRKHSFPLSYPRWRGDIILEKPPISVLERIFPFLRRRSSYSVSRDILPLLGGIIDEKIIDEVKYKIEDLSTYEKLREVIEKSVKNES